MMRLSNTTPVVAVASMFFCLSAVAQTRFCLGGKLDELTQAQKASCAAKMQTVRTLASALHAPENWHFVVVCGEEGWKSYASYAAGQEDALRDRVANTDFELRETFFRESRLDQADVKAFQNTVAHEIASITLGTKDEAAISQRTAQLLGQQGEHTGL